MPIDAEQVRAAVSIIDHISQFTELRKSGSEWIGKCPLHDDSRPSFSVNELKQVFKCHGCQAGGDVIQFVMFHRNMDFQQALKILTEQYGLSESSHIFQTKNLVPKADRELIQYFGIREHYPSNLSAPRFYAACARDPEYRAWLERDLAFSNGITLELVALIGKAQIRDGDCGPHSSRQAHA